MADEDNFDIDIYGDETTTDYQNENHAGDELKQQENPDEMIAETNQDLPPSTNGATKTEGTSNEDPFHPETGDCRQQISSTGGSSHGQLQPPKQAPIQQGTKRKDGTDDRPVDPGATTALLISDLHWWTNEDDIRGWANQIGCEDELKEVTFNEHKVNGKSKGQVYVEMTSTQAATALKHKVESFGQGKQYVKKHTAQFHAPNVNPYRTLPKDVPSRKDANRQDNRSMSGNFGSNQGAMGSMQNFNAGGNFRGRGGFQNQNRGGMNNMGMGFNQNRNFSPPMGGMPGGGFGGPMGGFGGSPMGGMPQFGAFRGGNMMGGGMRGGMVPNRGRGGMGPGMMGGMGMGGMGGMGMGAMNMGGMGSMGMGNMQGGFGNGPQGYVNPPFFGQNQGGGGDNWNPHGAKRPRPE